MNKYFDLNNRIYVITGGAGLLGYKYAEAILESNGIPVLFDINKDVEIKAQELSNKYGKDVEGVVVDITDENQVSSAVDRLVKKRIVYGLINNAANNPVMDKGVRNSGRLESLTIENWNNDFAVSVTGAFLMSKYLGTVLAKNGEGVIINISSDLGIIAPDQRLYIKPGETTETQNVKPITYSVIKHAIIGLTKYLSTYWADRNIRVNSISPGGVYSGNPDPEFVKRISNLIPLGRMANVDEYKGTIIYLCSDASSYMNGANVVVDGGRSVW